MFKDSGAFFLLRGVPDSIGTAAENYDARHYIKKRAHLPALQSLYPAKESVSPHSSAYTLPFMNETAIQAAPAIARTFDQYLILPPLQI